MKAIILAGGKGTRMESLTKEIPKPMISIGDKPILEHQIELLKKYNIREIIILVSYLKDFIIKQIGNGEKWNVKIEYFEETTPLGTVGGIKEIESILLEDFIVFYGDVMINMNLARLISFHKKKNSECTLVLHPNDHPFDSDLVEINAEEKITAFHPKMHNDAHYYKNLVNAGVYILSPALLPYLEKGKKADFGKEIFPAFYKKINMFGYNTCEYLKDMGTPERLKEVSDDYNSGKIERSNSDYKQKAIFLDRDGVLNVEKNFIHTPDGIELYPFTALAIRKINKSEYKAIVITNQSVIARNLCTIEELENIHYKLETDLGIQHAKLDALYYCPHHPDKGYPEERVEFKIDCSCRKPKPGMLLKAAKDHNIDLTTSFVIGDSERDILAGKNADCITIGVMTGYGMRNTNTLPDYFFSNLSEVVNFIIDEPYRIPFNSIKKLNLNLPYIILVGGNARSGKSTLAKYLQLQYKKEGLRVFGIELDNWILPENERLSERNVFDRFQMNLIEREIPQILEGNKIEKTIYSSLYGENKIPFVYNYNNEEIIIIEGVVALNSALLRNLAGAKVFIDIEDNIHNKRIREYYLWRGKSEKEIEELYKKRYKDEYKLIKKAINFADFIINI